MRDPGNEVGPGGRAFDRWPRFHVTSGADFPEMAEINFDEFNGKDCVFLAQWLKTKGLHKLCSVFGGV